MQQIVNFILRNRNFLLFATLFLVAFSLTVQSHSYHKSKVVNSANTLTGGIFSAKHGVVDYFGLQKENTILLEENARLRNQVQQYVESNTRAVDTGNIPIQYRYIPAEVINNNYAKRNNYLTLKAGKEQGVHKGMGVITSRGIVGITDAVGTRYATAISILNTQSSISAKLKNSGHFGSLVWDGGDPNTVQLTDISRVATVSVGDTITTDGRSTIFPRDIPIGTVDRFTTDQSGNYYLIAVALFNDMTGIEHVYLIENTHAEEIQELESQSNDED